MADYSELKRLAEAAAKAQPGRWSVHRDGMGSEFPPHPDQNFGVDDERGGAVVWHGVGRSGGIWHEEVAEFIATAGPVAVLALIAENDRLLQFEHAYIEWIEKTEWVQASVEACDLGKHRADVVKARIDQLKADNDRQRVDIQSWRFAVDAERASGASYKTELDRLAGPEFAEELAALRKDAERYRRMRAGTLRRFDETPDDFDAVFDLQLDAATGKGLQS